MKIQSTLKTPLRRGLEGLDLPCISRGFPE